MLTVRDARPFFSKRERKAIEDLACNEPASVGRSLTHWSLRSLAQAAVKEELIEAISHAALRDILRAADLPIHGFRYWKTTIWDDEAVERALKILWYYERIESLWQKHEVILAWMKNPASKFWNGPCPNNRYVPGRVSARSLNIIDMGRSIC